MQAGDARAQVHAPCTRASRVPAGRRRRTGRAGARARARGGREGSLEHAWRCPLAVVVGARQDLHRGQQRKHGAAQSSQPSAAMPQIPVVPVKDTVKFVRHLCSGSEWQVRARRREGRGKRSSESGGGWVGVDCAQQQASCMAGGGNEPPGGKRARVKTNFFVNQNSRALEAERESKHAAGSRGGAAAKSPSKARKGLAVPSAVVPSSDEHSASEDECGGAAQRAPAAAATRGKSAAPKGKATRGRGTAPQARKQAASGSKVPTARGRGGRGRGGKRESASAGAKKGSVSKGKSVYAETDSDGSGWVSAPSLRAVLVLAHLRCRELLQTHSIPRVRFDVTRRVTCLGRRR